MRWKNIALTSFLIFGLAGCSLANRLVYRIDINQGNYIEQSAVEKLRFGMTKEQVQFLLGPPMLVETGLPNTWYYIHWIKPGHNKPKQKELVVNFDDKGILDSLTGDFKISQQFYTEYN